MFGFGTLNNSLKFNLTNFLSYAFKGPFSLSPLALATYISPAYNYN